MDKWEKLKGKAITACGAILENPDRYLYREYEGRRIYFCNQECLREFGQDPERFLFGNIVHPIARQEPPQTDG
jgi:YHS domain-containing protein